MNYLIPAICTIAIVVSLFFHFKKFKNIYIIISSLVLYYWSIAGSWFFILDRENPALGKKMGIHFHYYLDVLYPVQIDFYYFKAIILYTLFILSFIWGSYFFLQVRKPVIPQIPNPKPIHLNPVFLLLPALVGMAISFFSVHEEIMSSIRHFRSFYYTINADTTQRFHTLHLASNTLMAISSYTFLGLIMSPDGKFLVLDKSSKFIYRLGIFMLVLVLSYLILLGGRNYFIFGALLIFVLAYENSGTKQWLKKMVIGGIVLVAPLFLTELTRGTPIISLAIYEFKKPNKSYADSHEDDFFFKDEKQEKYEVSGASTLHSLMYSNEMFVPSFSMYAVLKEDLDPTNGKSLAWLVSSIIPSFVGIERPEDSYKYYIRHTRAADIKTQGFTIHHATGWYVNFGILGTVIGGLVLSLILSVGYKKYINEGRKWHKLCWFSAFAGTFIFVPRLIRSGPEGYKSIFLIAILFLMIVLLCGTILTKKQTD